MLCPHVIQTELKFRKLFCMHLVLDYFILAAKMKQHDLIILFYNN